MAADKARPCAPICAQATGEQVLPQTSVDPSIAGGVVAKVGDRVFDGGVAHLERVKAQLIDATR